MNFRSIFRKPSPLSDDQAKKGQDSRKRAAVEPCHYTSPEAASGDSCKADSRERFSSGFSQDNAPIFDLLGASADAAREVAARESSHLSEHVNHDDLIAVLNDQYYLALESPHALFYGEWMSSTPGSARVDEVKWLSAADEHRFDASASIRDLLSDIEKLEEAFGPLGRDVCDVAQRDDTPEILRLFAPPEYHVAAARRAASTPPTVARRDHHTLAIDSPLSALSSHANHTLPDSNA